MEGMTKEQLQEALSESDKSFTDMEAKYLNAKDALEGKEHELRQVQSTLADLSNWLRFTLGIAYNAHPDNEALQAMVKALYKGEK